MRFVALLALPIVGWSARAYAGAGIGELCDVQRHIAGRLVWSENLRTIMGADVDGEVETVAVQRSYVLAAGNRGGSAVWYIIDGAGGVETFAGLAAWEQRVAALGLTEPVLRNVRDFPRKWAPDIQCALVTIPLLAIILPLMHPLAAVLTAAVLLFGAAWRWRRRRRRSPVGR